MNTGIIYKITNLVNNKIYIGQTKEFKADGSTKQKYGIDGRLKCHFGNAFSKNKKVNTGCPILYNAIRKYGKDKFIVEELCSCKLEERNEKEKYFIKILNAIDNKIGYNISFGGNGGESNIIRKETNENIRIKISRSQSNGEMNIKPFYRNQILVGYIACRKQNGKLYKKIYSSTKFTPDQNKQNAINFIESIKLNKNDNNFKKYNRNDNLPRNIILKTNRNMGYEVCIQRNGIKYSKVFTNSKYTMEQNLQSAIEYKNSILESQK